MRILLDAMGGDKAPKEIVKGALEAMKKSKDQELEIILIGNEKEIKDILTKKKVDTKKKYDTDRISIISTTEVIGSEDIPTSAIKAKKDSSMVVGLSMIKEGKGDVFISAGNTGALMTGALMKIGRIKGVDRPALAPITPTKGGGTMLIDAGLNTLCKPINYLQFAIMGTLYMKEVFKIRKPTVGLINVGIEENKGNETTKKAYKLLSSNTSINFHGNIEGRQIPEGIVNIAVCDGFVGNILLKFIEGMGNYVSGGLKRVFTKDIFTKVAALLVKRGLKHFKDSMDYEEYGGTPILGIDGRVYKCHGSSNAKTIRNSIFKANEYAKSSVLDMMRKKFKDMGE